MLVQIFGGEDELLFRCHVLLSLSIGIKRVDDHGTVDFDRIGIVIGVEKQSSTEATHGDFAGCVQDRIGPNRQDARRRRSFIRFLPRPLVPQLNARTSGCQQRKQERCQTNNGVLIAVVHRYHFHQQRPHYRAVGHPGR